MVVRVLGGQSLMQTVPVKGPGGLIQLTLAEVSLPVPAAPVAASALGGHWLLGGSSDSLLDIWGDHSLTLTGSTPVYSTGYMTTVDNGLNGVLSSVLEGFPRTVFGIAKKVHGVDGATIFGSMVSSGSGGGAQLVIGSQALGYNLRYNCAGASTLTLSGHGINENDWFPFILVEDVASRRVLVGAGAVVTQVSAGTSVTGGRKLGFGNCYNASTTSDRGAKLSICGIIPGVALTEVQMLALRIRLALQARDAQNLTVIA